MASNLILCGGLLHDFQASSDALVKVLEPLGVHSTIERDIERGLAQLRDAPCEMLTINALRLNMPDEKYAADRAECAISLTAAARRTILEHVESGGALLGIHAASICFADWPEWGNVLGGAWRCGQSTHAALAPVSVRPTRHTLMAGVSAFEVQDELYSQLEQKPGITVLLEGSSSHGEGAQPVMWLHRFGVGRVVYDALGHNVKSISAPAHALALQRAVTWALDKTELEQ